jgi:hypothetical protein
VKIFRGRENNQNRYLEKSYDSNLVVFDESLGSINCIQSLKKTKINNNYYYSPRTSILSLIVSRSPGGSTKVHQGLQNLTPYSGNLTTSILAHGAAGSIFIKESKKLSLPWQEGRSSSLAKR